MTPDDVTARLDQSLDAVESLRPLSPAIATIAQSISDCLLSGGTMYTCGNGGSAAQAMHLAEELIGRYKDDREPLRAICLNADTAAMTCIANDYGYEQIFARQCKALLAERDILLVLSTSGASANVNKALEVARETGTKTIGLLGRDGGAAFELCSLSLVVPAGESALIQEAHQVVIHMICESVEAALRCATS